MHPDQVRRLRRLREPRRWLDRRRRLEDRLHAFGQRRSPVTRAAMVMGVHAMFLGLVLRLGWTVWQAVGYMLIFYAMVAVYATAYLWALRGDAADSDD